MKIIVDLEKKTLKMLENERSIFRGEYGADKLELYFNKEFTNEYPTITALLSNGRKIGPYTTDEAYGMETIDGVTYTTASFTLSYENGFTLSEGKTQVTIWLNKSNGIKEAIGNVTFNVINTTAFDDGDIIISGDVAGTLVNYRVELENLQSQLGNINAKKVDTEYLKLNYYTNVTTDIKIMDKTSNMVTTDTYQNNITGVKDFKGGVGFYNDVDFYTTPKILASITSDNHATNKKYVDDVVFDNIVSVTGYVNQKVAELVSSAPETLDTLKELSNALGNDPNFATTIANRIGLKADKSYVDDLYGKLNLYDYVVYNNPEVVEGTLYLENGYVKDDTLYLKNAKVENGVLYIDYIE